MSHPVIKYLDKMIADCEGQLKEAEDTALSIQGQLIAYKRARIELESVVGEISLHSGNARTRDFSWVWKSILRYIYENNETSIDEIDKFCSERNFEVQRGAIRSQLHVYKSRGVLDRVDTGKYRLTEHGKEFVILFDVSSDQK